MDIQAGSQAALIAQSFGYVARQLAGAPGAAATFEQYEQIRSEAEKHSSALNLVLRDVTRMADTALRSAWLTQAERDRVCMMAALTIAEARQAIDRNVAQYAPHRLAA